MSVRVVAFAVLSSRIYAQVDGQVERKENGGHAYRDYGGNPLTLSFDVPSEEGWHKLRGTCKSYTTDTSVCFSDNDKSQDYENDTYCEFAYVGDATLTWEQFDIEDKYYHAISLGSNKYYYDCSDRDYIVVDDTIFCGVEEPEMKSQYVYNGELYSTEGVGNFYVPTSKTFDVTGVTRFKFKADWNRTFKGFTICAPRTSTAPASTTPTKWTEQQFKNWCGENDMRCLNVCEGNAHWSNTCVWWKDRKQYRCKNYRDHGICDKLPGCVEKTKTHRNDKTKIRCKGKIIFD